MNDLKELVNVAKQKNAGVYFSTNDLASLRANRFQGTRKLIWGNLAQSADWCLTRDVRQNWIAPVSPDPRYENLYDRFYAIMADLAITEHLSFAYAFSGDARYGEAARQWVLASCRTWQHEADAHPDSGKAYAVSRLLKGVAVGYDAVFDYLTANVRDGIATISGEVRLPVDKQIALATVNNTEGVKGVVDEIRVSPASFNDDRIRLRLLRAIYGDSTLGRYGTDPKAPIRIIVNNGHVMLDGWVQSNMDRDIAGIRANQVFGAFSVKNNLVVNRG